MQKLREELHDVKSGMNVEKRLKLCRLLVDEWAVNEGLREAIEAANLKKSKKEELRRDAYEGGSASAKFLLAYCIRNRVVEAKEEDERLQLLHEAAEMGHRYARFQEGYCYMHGEGGAPKNEDRALELFEQATLDPRGCGEAARFMSSSYIYQWGSRKADKHLAAVWARRAGELGYRGVQDTLNRLMEETPEEIAPYGRWTKDVHWCVPKHCQLDMFYWLLVAKRLGIPRDIV